MENSAPICRLSAANCKPAFLRPSFTTTSIDIVGAPTFLSLAPPLSFFRIFLNLKLPTDNLKQPNPNHSRTSETFARKSNYSRTFAKTGGGSYLHGNVSTICRRADNFSTLHWQKRSFLQRPCYDSCRDRHCPKCQSLARARIQLARSKNSWLSSSRSGVVLPHSKPFAVSQAPCSLPWPSPPQTPQYSASCSFLSLPTARPLDVDSHSPIKTHSTRTLQRFSPIHF